jgi:hypothetical protein
MVTGPAGIITSARSRRPGRRHSAQRRVTMLPRSPARMLLITLASPRLSAGHAPILRLRVATAPVGLETVPTSATTMPMLTVRLMGVYSRRAPPHGTAPPLSAPASLSHPSESRASRVIAGAHEEAPQSPRLTPLTRGDLRHFSSARVTRAPQLTSMASPGRESIPVWIWPSTC